MKVRKEKCVDCGCIFVIPLEEFLYKLDHNMKLPKRCTSCRKKNRQKPNPYHGLRQTMHQYPSTKGHRHRIHGGV